MRQALIGAWMGLCLSSDWTCGLHFLVWIPPSPLFGQLTSEPINPSPLGLALSLSPSLENLPLLLIHESKHIVVKYYMYLMLIVYWIFINGLSNWNSILLTSWKIGVSGNACFLGIFFVGLCSHLWWVGIWWCHLCWACFSCVGAMGRGFRRGKYMNEVLGIA